MIKHFFKDRDCAVLVRPSEDEKNLQALGSMDSTQLRQEFVNGVDKLRNKLFLKAKPKLMKGQSMQG